MMAAPFAGSIWTGDRALNLQGDCQQAELETGEMRFSNLPFETDIAGSFRRHRGPFSASENAPI